MVLRENIGPTGMKIPPPDLLLLSYTGCFTFMKWFEVLRKMFPDLPVVMVHIPFRRDSVLLLTDRSRGSLFVRTGKSFMNGVQYA
jgi:hypothetical protein